MKSFHWHADQLNSASKLSLQLRVALNVSIFENAKCQWRTCTHQYPNMAPLVWNKCINCVIYPCVEEVFCNISAHMIINKLRSRIQGSFIKIRSALSFVIMRCFQHAISVALSLLWYSLIAFDIKMNKWIEMGEDKITEVSLTFMVLFNDYSALCEEGL